MLSFRVLSLKLFDELTDKKLKELACNFDLDVQQTDADGLELFDEMIRCNKISNSSIERLCDALHQIGRIDLIEKHCRKFKRELYFLLPLLPLHVGTRVRAKQWEARMLVSIRLNGRGFPYRVVFRFK